MDKISGYVNDFGHSLSLIGSGITKNNKQFMLVLDRMTDLSMAFWRQEPSNMGFWMEHQARISLSNPYYWWTLVILTVISFLAGPMVSVTVLVTGVVLAGVMPAAAPFVVLAIVFGIMAKRRWFGRVVVGVIAVAVLAKLIGGTSILIALLLIGIVLMWWNPRFKSMALIAIAIGVGISALGTSAQLPLLIVGAWASLCWLFLKK
ncbi:MAG: hypothetical protein UY72_C0064G0011 [Candidatus Uhrbacteria bacterium GW2011_GWD2_52_7]|uniref:Uncharacterized protein n=1 Tax=Candidatus Uhrbacteria bacterium GW2011_GWD2_52_7 TaxID=1618989 RepID=A0A0G1XBL7_9BACT|nr:MAG: hypothetical protein UY72_C0064G0011 [Candidatus Uhrbacteria bacterium GW2011_GWD2_52_7]